VTTGSLSRRAIVGTALAIIDRDGADGLSMRRLGRELGADPKAVCYYVPNKAALFDRVIDAPPADPDPGSLSPSIS